MTTDFPKLTKPPIVELVLGIRFTPLTKMTSGHLGWFWKSFLGPEWESTLDAPVVEQVGNEEPENLSEIRSEFHLLQSFTPRLQIHNRDKDRLIQLQNSGLFYNWKKQKKEYPRFSTVLSEFKNYLNLFENFIREAGVGAIEKNQWEVTYVDKFLQGESWDSYDDLADVLPGLFPKMNKNPKLLVKNYNTEIRMESEDKKSKIKITSNKIKSKNDPAPSVFINTTITGAFEEKGGVSVEDNLRFGHSIALEAFFSLINKSKVS